MAYSNASRSASHETRALSLSFALSLGIHIAILSLLALTRVQTFAEPTVFSVVLEPPLVSKAPAPRVREQIVSTPDVQESAEVVPITRFQSERNVAVEKEQIKRGEPDAGPIVAPEAAPQPEPPAVKRQAQAGAGRQKPPSRNPTEGESAQPQLALKLDDRTLLREFNTAPSEARSLEDLEGAARSAAGYAPFSRPFGSGAAFLGSRGSRDYIPTLPDGDITLLNTKANQFAVFVRRVATNVFGQLRSSGWEVIRATDIRQIQDFATVRAELSLQGELLSVRIDGHSGSAPFDDVLRDAVQRGARDPNPPKAAATDGKIKFVFQARSWARMASNPRTGAPVERRWLLLATGLE